MSDNKELFDQIEATFDERDFQAMFEFFNDGDVVRSLRVDIPSEVALLETRNLDPILALTTVASSFFVSYSPWREHYDLVSSGGLEANHFLAKLVLHHFRQKVRPSLGLPLLTDEQLQAWMVRKPRPDLPINKVVSNLPKPKVITQIWHSPEEHKKIAKLFEQEYPEDAAYVRVFSKDFKDEGRAWRLGFLNAPDDHIDVVEAYLFPDKKPGARWFGSFEIRNILKNPDVE